ncbi:MAG: hypothetical protein LBV70_06820 [Candidatus Adiutrix sp.]|jgi:uncharacterized protein YqhQ|nr:hypothetical protein [Candidatus Adiutrix sp.]
MTVYNLIMWAYNALAFFIVLVLVYNLFKCRNFWEQVIAFFVIYPFVFRILSIK